MTGIPLHNPQIPESAHTYLREVVNSGRLDGNGPFTARCEHWLEAQLGVSRALLTNSGSTALEIAALVLDIQPGDEIIMPSWTFPSTANAFVLRGGTPVFVDIRPDTLNLDEQQIEAAITPRTRAITVVHYAGVASEMDRILAIARKHGLRVIEDAAQGFLARYRDSYLGTLGDLGVLSFHQTKTAVCGEGGALLINDPTLLEHAEIARDKGTNRQAWLRGEVDSYQWTGIGVGAAPSEITAAVLLAQLEQAVSETATRQTAWHYYARRLGSLTSGLILQPDPSPNEINGSLFTVRAETAKEAHRIRNLLKKGGIEAAPHYVPLHITNTGSRIGRVPTPLPITEITAKTLLRLPLWNRIDFETQDRVITALIQSASSS